MMMCIKTKKQCDTQQLINKQKNIKRQENQTCYLDCLIVAILGC